MLAARFKQSRAKLVRVLCTLICALAVCFSVILIHTRGSGEPSYDASQATPPPTPTQTASPRFTVAIDPGHGQPDGGAVGTDTGIAEESINLAYARALSEELASLGIASVLTRTDEAALDFSKKKDMAKRVDIINSSKADAAISIHMNKFSDRSVSGPMAFYSAASLQSEALAKSVLDSVCLAIGRPARIVNPGDYYITENSLPPTIILECGFLSNAADEALLLTDDHMRTMMRAAAQGIVTFLEGEEIGS